MAESAPVLCVDLDGTLIRTDLLIESFLDVLRRQPWVLFLLPLWLWRGKAALKHELALRSAIDVSLLPLNPQLLEWLRAQHAAGRRLWLATASSYLLAEPLAARLGVFERVFASSEAINLSGARKLQALREATGANGFDYCGNAAVDLDIWPHARQAIVVEAGASVLRAARACSRVGRVFEARPGRWRSLLRAMRPHQWLKNLLVFVPLLAAHQWSDPLAWRDALLCFAAFSLCASSVYLLNDLFDLAADRVHPRKCRRPFASGDASALAGLLLVPVLMAAGLGVAAMLSVGTFAVTLLYMLATLAYSWRLKTLVLVDVLMLAGLYTVRVIAGAQAIAVQPSFWLLAFSMFVFLSLALVKRVAELVTLIERQREQVRGRDYRVDDLAALRSMGVSAGYLAVLVLAFYINAPEVVAHYHRPQVLWLVCPGLLYWLSRLWLKTSRGEMDDDPLVFTLRDAGSRYALLAMLLAAVAAV